MRVRKPKAALVLFQIVSTLVIYALPVLIPAGPGAWPSAWIFLALWFGFWLFILIWLYVQNPGLFWERMLTSTSGQKAWDKALVPLLYGAIFLWLLFIAFDAGRFHWSPVPPGVEAIGAAILGASFVVFFLTFRANRYLSTVVRVQEERGQVVVTSGPYRLVRHPMYAATLLFLLGTPLLLGGWYGVLLSPIAGVILAWRAVLEERTLQKALLGYGEYMKRTRYRLIPFVW